MLIDKRCNTIIERMCFFVQYEYSRARRFLDLARRAKVDGAAEELVFLDGRPAPGTWLAHGSAVKDTPVSTGMVIEVNLAVPAAQIHHVLDGVLDRVVERAAFCFRCFDHAPLGMEPGVEEDVLQTAVADTPHTWLADEEVFEARFAVLRHLVEKPLEMSPRKAIAERRDSSFIDVRVRADLGLGQKQRVPPTLDGDGQVGTILEMEQELVFLGQRTLARVVENPLPAAAQHKRVIRLDGYQDGRAVASGCADRLAFENRRILFRGTAGKRELVR